MKLRINGYARHGKDTVADIIAKGYGLIKPDASRIIARYLVTSRLPRGWYPGTLDEQIEEAYQDRVNHRTGWYNFVSDMGAETLCLEVMREGDIYVGERRRQSFDLTKGLFDYSIWVDATGRGLLPEPGGSCDITSDGHDYIINNNGTLEELETEVHSLMTAIGVPRING